MMKLDVEARGASAAAQLPRAIPEPPPVPEPRDIPYPGTLELHVDCTDVRRGIYRIRQIIPVAGPGALILVYPKWLPGFHAPQAPIELFAGLSVTAAGRPLVWKRHPVSVNTFHLDVPPDVAAIEVEFQFLSPTDAAQGRVLCSETMLLLPWNSVLLHPAGYYARRTMMAARLTLPPGWSLSCALHRIAREGDTHHFEPAPLDVLVDSPVLAGRHLQRIELAKHVHLTLAGDRPEQVAPTPEQIAPHRALVAQADRLFGVRHFDRFEMLLGLSDTLTAIGVEHHRSFEGITRSDLLTAWDANLTNRDTVAHEYLHSWNGKHRRGADSWQPCFEKPIRNSLMWVYEGLTQYWTNVLCARSGLWTAAQTREALAFSAARYDIRPGSRWRPIIDTTRDPIIAARAPLPWPSWQRSEDYYAEGALVWLDVDTRLRELSGDTRSLDDFARAFFGGEEGDWTTRTYRFEDVVAALDAVAPFDWTSFFERAFTQTHERARLGGLERSGYRLTYGATPTEWQAAYDATSKHVDLTHSLGLTASASGKLGDVLWDGPAFEAALTLGDTILAVAGETFTPETLRRAVSEAGRGNSVELVVKRGKLVRTVVVACPTGPRYPRLEPIPGARLRLDEILVPLGG